MAKIRSKDTKPELRLRKALWAAGCRYRLHYDLPGRPDIVFLRKRLAIFMDGCFWHGCPLHYSAPRTREDFWKAKLRQNVMRDMAADEALIREGWEVFRIWEHELANIEKIVEYILNFLGRPHQTAYGAASPIPATTVAESPASYGNHEHQEPAEADWRTCHCGSEDLRVLSVSGHGSLRPNSRRCPESAELICRKCGSVRSVKVPRPDQR